METITLACSPDQLTALQRAAGYVSLAGTIKVLGALTLLIGVAYIFWGVIKTLLEWTGFIEVALWFAAVGSVTLSYFIGEWQIFALLPGSGLLAGAAIYSAHIREFEINKCRFGALMALIWGAIALFFGSSAVGFLSVGALMMSMGFIIEKTPLCTYFGFKDDSLIGPAAAQSTLLVVGYTAIKVAGFASALSVFEPGVFWLASFVSMLSMLILSSKWYPAESGTTVLMNFGALALYFGAIAVGNYYSIGALATMGTTFFIFFASEKILEIPASSAIGFGAKLVTVGGFLMWVWHLMHTEPILQRLMAG